MGCRQSHQQCGTLETGHCGPSLAYLYCEDLAEDSDGQPHSSPQQFNTVMPVDKLTLISGTLFLAADIFAVASLSMPDWIVTEVINQ